ncbi:tRNA (guanosine(37)-N1)-methyltransferase TrmD [Candidatus Fermentibacterales bacterium]|nr:tRNA (guanosine(37)-N1)-methyltransferase TrmD [Candidatus Fermentibacterales bacterium]
MNIAICTIFPDLLEPFLRTGTVSRAISRGLARIDVRDIRAHSVDDRGSVDDYQFGGGAGMLMRPEPLFETLESIPWSRESRVILMSPAGRPLTHSLAGELAKEAALVLFCGRYGGVDERFRSIADDEISVCDAVTSGGELPAMILVEAVLRWIPGVLGRLESARTDSFSTGLLDFPRYTRPAAFRGMAVPEVLLSGNHAAIIQWRFQQALERTRKLRPDLLEDVDVDALRTEFEKLQERADRSSIVSADKDEEHG